MLATAERYSQKLANELQIDRNIPEIQNIQTLNQDSLITEHIQAKIPLIDPRRPKKTNIDPHKIPR